MVESLPKIEAPTVPSGSIITTTESTSQSVVKPSLISAQLRNFVVIVLTAAMIYMALIEKNDIAIAALITAWTWSAGGMFQERAALKIKGTDT